MESIQRQESEEMTTGHPVEDESCSDSVWRKVNEIDFVGQRHASNISLYCQILSGVSNTSNASDCSQ